MNMSAFENEEFLDKLSKVETTGLSPSSQYLIDKVKRKAEKLRRELDLIADYIIKLKNRVNVIVEPCKKAALNVTDCGSILKLFKEVTGVIGSADTEITMLKVGLTFLGDFIKGTEVEYDQDKSNPGSKNGENCKFLHTSQVCTDVGSVEIVANNNGACAYTTLSREETVQKESMIATTYEKIHSELKSTITRIGEVKMPEARSTTVLGIESGVTRGKEKMKQELNRKISKSRAKESGFIKGPDIRPCPEPAQRQTGLTREMRELNLKHSVAVSSVTVELHRRQQLEMVKKRLEEYGEPYLVGDYNKFMMTFEI